MNRRLRTPVLALLGGMLVNGCAGSAPPTDLLFPTAGAEGTVLITEQAAPGSRLNRPADPQSNASFIIIDGTPFYKLGPKDEVTVTIYVQDGVQSFSSTVDPSGDIQIPSLLPGQRIRIGGLAVPQAETRLIELLGTVLRRPRLSLQVTAYHSSEVTLLGEVSPRGPDTGVGIHALRGRTTLLEYLFANGTFTEMADQSAVIVTDAEGRRAVFDLQQILYGGMTEQDPVLDRGDIVLVPSVAQTRSRIYVIGEVSRPSLLAPAPGMRVLDALLEAGGVTERGSGTWVTLVRGRGPEAQLYKIPYGRILRAGDVQWDVPLEPGDILYVGMSGYDQAVQFFRDTWSVLQTAVIVTVLADRFK